MVHIKTCNLWKGMRLTDLNFPMGPIEQLPFHLSYLRMKTNPLSEIMCYFLQQWRVEHVQNPGICKLWLKFLQQWYERRNLNLKTMKCKPKFLEWLNTTLLSLPYLPLFSWTYITLGPAPPHWNHLSNTCLLHDAVQHHLWFTLNLHDNLEYLNI